jgi:hypothetical protein
VLIATYPKISMLLEKYSGVRHVHERIVKIKEGIYIAEILEFFPLVSAGFLWSCVCFLSFFLARVTDALSRSR